MIENRGSLDFVSNLSKFNGLDALICIAVSKEVLTNYFLRFSTPIGRRI